MWLTKADPSTGDQDREEYLQPTETAKMQTSIRNFLTKNKGKPSVILLDGMTYIITNTDFRSFLKIAQKMKDDVYQAQSLLLLPYEPKNLAESEMNLLINEMS
jgi:adenosyl cobinamide kinase/adenosyl cobinamide phosphate guanylyltransferase